MAKVNNVGLNHTQKIANPFKTSRNSTTNPFKYSNFEGNTLQFADVFEGFEAKKGSSKAKLISSTIVGSMTKLRSLLPESIVNFVNRVREGVSNAWTYAKNTNITDVAGIKQISGVLNTDIRDIGKGIGSTISGIGSNVSEFLNKDVTELGMPDLGKGLSNTMAFLNKDVTELGMPDLGKGLSSTMAFLNKDVSDIGKGISEKMSFLNMDVTEIGKGMSDRWNSLISNINHKRITKETPVAELKTMWLDEISRLESEAA